MDFRFSPPEEAFRQEIRDWLKGNLPDNWTGDRFSRGGDDPEGMNVYAEFARRLATKGWVAPHWPKEYGGLGLSVVEQLIFNEEMANGNAPIGYSSIGVGWAGPTIIVYGTG
jgi:alkylation response protein AidB-like acyl-CoA dehydrogenase